MSTIADVIKLKSGYANFVELKSAFEESKENADRMAMYRPTTAHRRAFERICRGLYQPNDKKFYLLSGSYGTGKSHLCLMLANVLSRSSGDPAIKGFYDNYEKLDAEHGRQIRNLRKSGQYLVAICDYHSGKRFEDVVLKAVLDACSAAGLNTGVQTEFDEAQRVLDNWQKKGNKGIRNFFTDFEKALEIVAPGLSVQQLVSGLKQIDSGALENFRSGFREVMGGQEFQAASGNLIPIVKNVIKSKEFKERFRGIAVFFDEFGYTLEKGAYARDILHGFMETVCQSEPNVMFVGCIHKSFRDYADRFSKADAGVMEARTTQVDLLNEGIEEIIGAIVEVDKTSEIWKQEIGPKSGVFDQFLPVCKTLNLFPWIHNQDKIRGRVLEDIYGVHPMALACLLRLSSEIGSDARSTFTFFSGDVGGAEGSYAEFIKDGDVATDGGKLNLYTCPRLFDFFKKELSVKNPDLRDRQRQLVSGYYASLETLRKAAKEELFKEEADSTIDILKTVLLYQLCSPSIPASAENIKFGMYCVGKAEEKQVDAHLKRLEKAGALFYRQQSETYELAIGSGDDPYALIDRYLKDSTLYPPNVLEALLEEAPESADIEFLEAKQHNLTFNEDKRFFRRFVLAKDITADLWNAYRKEWEQSQSKDKKSAEGVVVYAICEDDAALQMARHAVTSVPYDNMALAIPVEPTPFTEALLKVKACRYYLPPGEAATISAQTEARLRDIFEDPHDGLLPQLHNLLNVIMSGEKAIWYGENGKVIVDRPKQPHDAVNRMCAELFKKRCLIKHPDLNLKHDDKWESKNTALRQAVNMLLQGDTVQIDNGNPDNHGEKRYLEKVLLKGAGALHKIKTDGAVSYFECESDPAKLSDELPILKHLCKSFEALKPGEVLTVSQFMTAAKQPPYGAGSTCLALVLAYAIRAFGERLRIFADTTKTAEQTVRALDDVVDILVDPATKVVFEVKNITEAQVRLVEGLAQASHAPALKHGEKRTLQSAYMSLTGWWQPLPDIAKVSQLYDKADQKAITKLYDAFGQASSVDRYQFVLEVLPGVYVNEVIANLSEKDADGIVKDFTAHVKLLETGISRAKNQLADAVCKAFGAKTGDYKTCERVVTDWYHSLNPDQQDFSKYDDEETSHLVKVLSEKKTDFEDKLMILIPSTLGFGPVSGWTATCFEECATKLKAAKKMIDDVRVKVPGLPIAAELKSKSGEPPKIEMPKGVKGLVYATNGNDPKLSENAKQVKDLSGILPDVKDKPSAVIMLRTVDAAGNFGDLQQFKWVNLDREFDVNVENGMFGSEGHFKFPNDEHALMLVLRSLVAEAEKRGVINKKKADQLRSAIG